MNERYAYLDIILQYMRDNFPDLLGRPDDVTKKAGLDISANNAYSLLYKLYKDGYVSPNPKGTVFYAINQDGMIFIEDGGYVGEYEKYLDKEAVRKAQLKEIQSVIDTNVSVKSTNVIQKWSLLTTGAAIIGTLVFQALSYYTAKDEYKLHREQDQQQKQRMKSDSLTIDGLRERLISIQKQLDDRQKAKKP